MVEAGQAAPHLYYVVHADQLNWVRTMVRDGVQVKEVAQYLFQRGRAGTISVVQRRQSVVLGESCERPVEDVEVCVNQGIMGVGRPSTRMPPPVIEVLV